MADSAPPSTGAARKARERRARASAKHVQWLASCYQTLASHHTRPSAAASGGSGVDELRREVELLRKEIGSLRTQVQKTAGPAVAADTAAGSEPAVIRAEAAGRVDFGVEKGTSSQLVGPRPLAQQQSASGDRPDNELKEIVPLDEALEEQATAPGPGLATREVGTGAGVETQGANAAADFYYQKYYGQYLANGPEGYQEHWREVGLCPALGARKRCVTTPPSPVATAAGPCRALGAPRSCDETSQLQTGSKNRQKVGLSL